MSNSVYYSKIWQKSRLLGVYEYYYTASALYKYSLINIVSPNVQICATGYNFRLLKSICL